MSQKYYAYLLRCADDTLYGGFTTDPTRRLATHNAGKGAKYTKVRRPVRMVYLEACRDKSEALKREYAIKQMRRADKIDLIAQQNPKEAAELRALGGKD